MESTEDQETAIIVRGAYKQYGNKDSKMILDNLDMTVNKGTIYGLLGASGCGKTTLLSAIVGCKKIQGGMISVFGQSPGASAVKSIGYMPQDIALVGEFTVKGALEHYGWIFGMTNEQINERHAFLEKLLDLPPAHKLVKHLSGGQQRRVSLAVVLVHDPQLLILDEPTVGLDPVLRQNIWDYLVKITEEQKKTIIITTHYIEEARQAHMVGLMRNGKILAEGAPHTLLNKFNCSTLEDVFLLLSKKQKEGRLSISIERKNSIYRNSVKPLQILENKKPKKTLWQRLWFTNKGHAKALMSKNLLRFKRHPGTLAFAFAFPMIEVGVFFLAIGVIPNDIKVGIVNEEMGNYTNCKEYSMNNPVGGFPGDNSWNCNYYGLGCKFVANLGDKLQNQVRSWQFLPPEGNMSHGDVTRKICREKFKFSAIYFKTKEEALEEARKGNIHHVIYFPSNYSESVTVVRDGSRELTDEDLNFQEISIYRDVFDYTLSIFVQKEFVNAFKRYQEGLAVDCNTSVHAEKWPIVFNDPVYGSEDLTYTDFMAPGVILAVVVFLSMSISTLTITTERFEGIWERTTVAGVSSTEILIFHTLTLCLVGIVQLLEVFIIAFSIFQLPCQGEKILVISLAYMQLIAGICFGILISIITRNASEAILASLGLFYPFLTMSGMIWPLEGMPDLLRYFSYLVPITISVESMSHIIQKGWGLANYHVFKGFLASVGFIAFFTFLSIITLKYGRK